MTLPSGQTKGKGRMEKSIFTPEYDVLLRLLKQVRIDAGLTQIQFAERLSLTQSLFSKMERGELRIDIVQLRTMCRILGVSLSEFIRRWEKELAENTARSTDDCTNPP
jgi:transcriptional regulator with XRE-family HTH domain